MKKYYVYMLSNNSKTIYIGVTNNLMRRMFEHKNKLLRGFSSKYNLTRLVYFEETNDVREAIQYEKKLKGWLRSKKIELIEKNNPNWLDLSNGWFA